MKSENPGRTELFTDLSTLSTNFRFKKLVYIVFNENGRFVEFDKIQDICGIFCKELDKRDDRA